MQITNAIRRRSTGTVAIVSAIRRPTPRSRGPKARPCNPAWIEEVAHECEVAGIPFFDKRKTGWIRREWPT